MRKLRFVIATNRCDIFDADTNEKIDLPVIAFVLAPVESDRDILVTLTVYADKVHVLADNVVIRTEPPLL